MSVKRKLANTAYILLTVVLIALYVVPTVQIDISGIGNFFGSLSFGGSRTKLAYQVDSANKACQITGIGRYKEAELIIPTEISGNRVTSIGDSAFYYCTNVKSVAIPYTVNIIGNYAFTTCHDLESAQMDYGVQKIGICLFMSCRKLKTVTIPASVNYIGQFAFYDCPELTAIHFGGTMQRWKEINHDTYWNQNNNRCVVYCSDGTLK